MAYTNMKQELDRMLKDDPEFREKFERDEVFRSFVEVAVRQANVCDRALEALDAYPETREHLIDAIARYCAGEDVVVIH